MLPYGEKRLKTKQAIVPVVHKGRDFTRHEVSQGSAKRFVLGREVMRQGWEFGQAHGVSVSRPKATQTTGHLLVLIG